MRKERAIERQQDIRSNRVQGCKAPLLRVAWGETGRDKEERRRLTAGIANLDTSLTDVERDNFPHLSLLG